MYCSFEKNIAKKGYVNAQFGYLFLLNVKLIEFAKLTNSSGGKSIFFARPYIESRQATYTRRIVVIDDVLIYAIVE